MSVGTPQPGQDQTQGHTGEGPWADELAARFEDAATRQAVDSFLREKVQPYVTQVEQEARPALELYRDLQANPGATYMELTEDLFGEDEAKAITGYLEGRYAEGNGQPLPSAAEIQQEQPPVTNEQAASDPRMQEMLNDWEEQRNEKLYESELQRLQTLEDAAAQREQRQPLPIKDHLFRPFVVAEDGDMDKAFIGYKAFVETARTELFGNADVVEQAPPTLGGNTSGATPPPTEKNYQGDYGAAIDDWANEQASQGVSPIPAPPTR